MKITTLIACSFASCLGCSLDVGSTEQSGAGEYTVPTTPSLERVATNPVDKVTLSQDKEGNYHLGYTLPAVLAGFKKDVYLAGPRIATGELVLTGEAGSATCLEADDHRTITCAEHLTGIAVDIDQVATALDARGVTGADRSAYIEVASRFSIDPLGVLTFELPP